MKVSPDVEAKILRMAGVEPGKAAPREKPKLVSPASWQHLCGGVWVVPAEVPSLSNSRDWKTRNRVAQAHRRAVSRAVGPTLRWLAEPAWKVHSEGAKVHCTLTRIAPRMLDAHDNLPASLKYFLDAVCLLIGLDDSDPRLAVNFFQEKFPLSGVRVQVEVPG